MRSLSSAFKKEAFYASVRRGVGEERKRALAVLLGNVTRRYGASVAHQVGDRWVVVRMGGLLFSLFVHRATRRRAAPLLEG